MAGFRQFFLSLHHSVAGTIITRVWPWPLPAPRYWSVIATLQHVNIQIWLGINKLPFGALMYPSWKSTVSSFPTFQPYLILSNLFISTNLTCEKQNCIIFIYILQTIEGEHHSIHFIAKLYIFYLPFPTLHAFFYVVVVFLIDLFKVCIQSCISHTPNLYSLLLRSLYGCSQKL